MAVAKAENPLLRWPKSRVKVHWLLILIPLVVYLAFAVPNITLPGTYYDEVLQVLPAMDAVGYPITPDYILLPRTVIGIGDLRLPFMTTSYLGALESMIFVPVFAILPVTVTVVRGVFIALGMVTIVLSYFWGRQLFGTIGGMLLALLLATDSSYIFFTRADNGPVDTMMLIKLGMLICLTAWWKTRGARWFYLGMFLMGVGIYDKANFIWFIVGGIVAVALFGFRELYRRVWGRHNNKASMLQDLEKGNPTEIDYINGVVSRGGRECGIATPFNDKVVEIVKEAEARKEVTGWSNLARFDEIIAQAK